MNPPTVSLKQSKFINYGSDYMRSAASLLIAVACAAYCCQAYSGQTVSNYSHTPDSEFKVKNPFSMDNIPGTLVSPHVKWAEPSVFSKINALIILPRDAVREVIELKQRLSLDAAVVFTDEYKPTDEDWYAHPFGTPDVQLARMTDKLHPAYNYDVIIIGKVKWSVIPEKCRAMIIQHINKGAALLYIDPQDAGRLSALVNWDSSSGLKQEILNNIPGELLTLETDFKELRMRDPSLPARKLGPLEIKSGRLGKGKVCYLDYKDLNQSGGWRNIVSCNALTPLLPYDRFEYEYQQAILIRLLLALCDRDAGIKSGAVCTTVDYAALPGTPVKFTFDSTSAPLIDFIVDYEVRDRSGQVVAQGQNVLNSSAKSATFSPEIPQLRRGDYSVDVWLKRDSRIAVWSSAALRVSGAKYLGKINFERPFQTNDRNISGTVVYATQPGADMQVRISLFDSWSRLVARTESKEAQTRFSFAPVSIPLSTIYDVVCEVVDRKGQVIDRLSANTFMPKCDFDDFLMTAWLEPRCDVFNLPVLFWSKKLGFNAIYSTSTIWNQNAATAKEVQVVARHNFLHTPYFTGIWDFKITPQKKFQQTLSEYSDKNSNFSNKAKILADAGTLLYSICEENYIARDPDVWNNPEAVKEFAAYLKTKYSDIETLNSKWHSSFKSFDNIAWLSLSQAKVQKLLPQWLTQEQFKIAKFAEVHRQMQDTIRKYDPQAKTSLDCNTGLNYDWSAARKDFAGYTGGDMNSCDGFYMKRNPGNYAGNWWGSYIGNMDEFMINRAPWQILFGGGNTIYWWSSALSYSLDKSEPLPFLNLAGKNMQEIASGTGKLLINSQPSAQVAILYSPESEFADIALPRSGSHSGARNAITSGLQYSGLAFDWVSAEYLRMQLLKDKTYKVVILPSVQTISTETAKALTEFAANGGLVIADVLPGVVDECLVSYETQESTKGGSSAGKSVTCPKCKGSGKIDTGITIITCSNCGGEGKIIEGIASQVLTKSVLADLFDFSGKSFKSCGSGGALFLNNNFTSLKSEFSAIRQAMIERAKIDAPFTVTNFLGAQSADFKAFPRLNGPAVFCGILPERIVPPPPGDAMTIALKQKYYAYNVRTHQFRGYTDRLDFALKKDIPELFAFLPERIDHVALTIARPVYQCGETAVISGKLLPETLKTVKMVVHVTVKRDNAGLPEFTANVIFNGNFEYRMPLALNQPGDYTVTVTEVISGIQADVNFTVK